MSVGENMPKRHERHVLHNEIKYVPGPCHPRPFRVSNSSVEVDFVFQPDLHWKEAHLPSEFMVIFTSLLGFNSL